MSLSYPHFDKKQYTHEDYINNLRLNLLNVYHRGKVGRILTHADYVLFAEMIEITLQAKFQGTSQSIKIGHQMSAPTLKRLLKYDHQNFSMNTLNKLAIFLKYKSWKDFKQKKDSRAIRPEKYQSKLIREAVKYTLQLEIDAIAALPIIDQRKIERLYLHNEVLNKNFGNTLIAYNEKGWSPVKVENRIDKMSILRQNAYYAEVYVEEHISKTWVDNASRQKLYQFGLYRWIISLEYHQPDWNNRHKVFLNEYGEKMIERESFSWSFDGTLPTYVEPYYEGWIAYNKLEFVNAYSKTENYLQGVSLKSEEELRIEDEEFDWSKATDEEEREYMERQISKARG